MEFLAKCDFCNTILVQSGKFSFQLSYQTFSIRLKTVVIKRHTNQTTGWIPMSNIWFKIMLEFKVHILGTFENLEYWMSFFQVLQDCLKIFYDGGRNYTCVDNDPPLFILTIQINWWFSGFCELWDFTNSHKIHIPGLKWTDRCSFSQMGHKNDLLEPTQCIPKPLDCDKHARKIWGKS